MSGAAEPVLRLEQLGVSMPPRGRAGGARLPLVEALDLAVRPGEMTALVGESGSGKTIAALAAMRLLPAGAATTGRALFEGVDLLVQGERRMRDLRGRIGMVFQNPLSALNPSMTIGAQVAEGHRLHGGGGRVPGRAEARARAVELLGEVGIPDPARRLDDYPHQFSGGQRQRVMIAAALACDPKVLIADEPTTGLDPLVARQILALLARLQRTHRLGVLFITHDLSIVQEHADRLAVLYAGRAVEWGEAGRFFGRPRHPYSQALLAAVPRLGQATLRGIPGTLPEPGARPPGCRFAPRCAHRRAPCDAGYPPAVGDDEEAAACLFPPPPPVLEAGHAAPAAFERGGTAPLLALEAVGVRYEAAAAPSLSEVSLELRRGECLGIVGESGSGKSTLGRAILHMLRFEGRILLDGEAVAHLPAAALRRARRRIQVVFQDPRESLNPTLRIGDCLAEPLRLGGVRERGRLAREVAALLRRVGLDPSLADRLPGQVSGGQAQRVAVARALAARPDIIVLDEPTSALDVSTQAMLLTLLRELSRAERVAYVIISHDLAAVSWLADRIAVLKEGRIVELADTAALIAAPRHAYSAALIATAPRLA